MIFLRDFAIESEDKPTTSPTKALAHRGCSMQRTEMTADARRERINRSTAGIPPIAKDPLRAYSRRTTRDSRDF